MRLNTPHFIKTFILAFVATMAINSQASADQYTIDSKGQHAFIQFKISHLGYSYVLGSFPDFEGSFEYNPGDIETSSINLEIDTTTVETSHADRNKHVRSADFLDVSKYPTASFASTSYKEKADGSGMLTGDLTLHGVTKPVAITTQKIGEGKDPWGSYRIGFEGETTITMADFGIDYNLGPASRTVDLYLVIEGIRQ